MASLLSSLSANLRARPLVWAAIALLVWTAVLRLPFLHIVDDDEAFFSLVAARWQHGELPYATSFDVKPPLLFLIYLIANLLGDGGLGSIKGLEIVSVAWGAWALFRLLSRHGGNRAAVWVAGLYPIYSLALGGVASPNILIQAPFLIMACDAALGAVDRPLRHAAMAGLWMAGAGLIKQTAAFEAIALIVFLSIYLPRASRLKGLAAFCLAGAIPCLMFVAYFAANHALGVMIDDVVLSAFKRLNGDVVSTPHGLRHLTVLDGFVYFLPQIKPLLVLAALAALVAMRLKTLRDRLPRPLLVLSGLWLAAAILGVLSLHAMYPFYFIALIAPLLILAGLMLTSGFDYSSDRRRHLTLIGFTVAAVAVPAWFERNALWLDPIKGRNDPAAIQATADTLKTLGVHPGDRLFVPNRGLMVYSVTKTLPATPWFHPLHLMCDFSTGVADPLSAGLASAPDVLVLANTDIRMTCETQARHDDITNALVNYQAVGTYSGKWDSFTVYRRKP